jgi:death-on-curing protein
VSRDIVWITKDVALRVHAEQLELHGGDDGILNDGHLEAALDRARTVVGYVPGMSIEELAALTAFALAKSHPFVDGNKRTACVVALMFLQHNGIEIRALDDELAQVFENVAKGAMTESGLTDWFVENTIPPEY